MWFSAFGRRIVSGGFGGFVWRGVRCGVGILRRVISGVLAVFFGIRRTSLYLRHLVEEGLMNRKSEVCPVEWVGAQKPPESGADGEGDGSSEVPGEEVEDYEYRQRWKALEVHSRAYQSQLTAVRRMGSLTCLSIRQALSSRSRSRCDTQRSRKSKVKGAV